MRDEWLPAVARLEGVRLLYYLKHAHGTGVSYNSITITALEDASAWERLAASVQGGPLQALSVALDDLRHDVTGKMFTPLPWSPIQTLDLAEVPGEPSEHETSVFMEDTVWPFEGRLEDYVEASGSHYAKEMEAHEADANAILRVQASFRTVPGAGRRREIMLWQKLLEPRALVPLILREVPEQYRRPGTWMHDGLEIRDQWESKLLRAVSWSPLY